MPPEKEAEFAEILEQIRHGERIDNFETIRIRKDSSRIDVSITTSPIKDIAGRIIGASSIGRDITGRKRAEAALRESEENYRRLVELSPDAIFILSEDRYVYVNTAGLELLGAPGSAEVIGKTSLDLVPPQCHAALRENVRPLREGLATPLHEEKFVRMNGTVVEVETTAIPFLYRGKPAFQVVTLPEVLSTLPTSPPTSAMPVTWPVELQFEIAVPCEA